MGDNSAASRLCLTLWTDPQLPSLRVVPTLSVPKAVWSKWGTLGVQAASCVEGRGEVMPGRGGSPTAASSSLPCKEIQLRQETGISDTSLLSLENTIITIMGPPSLLSPAGLAPRKERPRQEQEEKGQQARAGPESRCPTPHN